MPTGSRIKLGFLRPPHLPDVSLITSQAVHFSAPRHFHDDLEVSIQHSGVSELAYRGTTYAIPPSHFTLTHPGEVHASHSVVASPGLYRGLRIGLPLLHSVSEQIAGRAVPVPFFVEPLSANAETYRMLLYLHATLSDVTAPALEQQSLTLTVLTRLLTQHASGQPPPHSLGPERQAVAQVREYLQTHYADNVPLTQLAALVGLSPYHLNRVFRAQIGMPPHAYQTQVRVLRAKALLARGGSPGHVAVETGFASQSHLTRHFQHYLGITPGQYRRSTANRKNVVDHIR